MKNRPLLDDQITGLYITEKFSFATQSDMLRCNQMALYLTMYNGRFRLNCCPDNEPCFTDFHAICGCNITANNPINPNVAVNGDCS